MAKTWKELESQILDLCNAIPNLIAERDTAVRRAEEYKNAYEGAERRLTFAYERIERVERERDERKSMHLEAEKRLAAKVKALETHGAEIRRLDAALAAAESRVSASAREALTKLIDHMVSCSVPAVGVAIVQSFRDREYPAPSAAPSVGARTPCGYGELANTCTRSNCGGDACNAEPNTFRPTAPPQEPRRVTIQARNPCAASPAEFINVHVTPEDAKRIVDLAYPRIEAGGASGTGSSALRDGKGA